ncbi:MAG TPA: hypothetical protein VFY89_10505 [Ktedonobacterales bacterium]
MQPRHNGHRSDLTGDEDLHEAARSGQQRQGPDEERAASGDETAGEEALPPTEPPDDAQHWLERRRLERELDGE